MWQCLFQPGARVSVRVKWHLLFPEASTTALYLFACQGGGGVRDGPLEVEIISWSSSPPPPTPWTWQQEASVHLAGLASDHRLFLNFSKPLLFSSEDRATKVLGEFTKSVCVTLAWHLQVQKAQCTLRESSSSSLSSLTSTAYFPWARIWAQRLCKLTHLAPQPTLWERWSFFPLF